MPIIYSIPKPRPAHQITLYSPSSQHYTVLAGHLIGVEEMNNPGKSYVEICTGFGWFSLILGAIALATILLVLGGEFMS